MKEKKNKVTILSSKGSTHLQMKMPGWLHSRKNHVSFNTVPVHLVVHFTFSPYGKMLAFSHANFSSPKHAKGSMEQNLDIRNSLGLAKSVSSTRVSFIQVFICKKFPLKHFCSFYPRFCILAKKTKNYHVCHTKKFHFNFH